MTRFGFEDWYSENWKEMTIKLDKQEVREVLASPTSTNLIYEYNYSYYKLSTFCVPDSLQNAVQNRS